MAGVAEHRINVQEYYRMAETGLLRPGARVELLNGRIIDMSPIGSFHGGLVKRLIRIYTELARGRWQASAQDPLRLEDHSEPEPDFMLLTICSETTTGVMPFTGFKAPMATSALQSSSAKVTGSITDVKQRLPILFCSRIRR